MNKQQKIIIDQIKKYRNIGIYFHELPDLDALGGCFALYYFLKKNFPKKKIKIVGLNTLNKSFENNLFVFPQFEPITNSFYTQALAIVLDTANARRIYDQSYKQCAKIICIDHHIKQETIGHYAWIDPTFSACSEMLAQLFLDWGPSKMNKIICTYLYIGIIADTGRFLYPSTTSQTYEIISKLVKIGVDREKVHNAMYQKDKSFYDLKNYIFSKAHFNKKYGYAWAKLPKRIYDRFHIQTRTSMVNTLANINGINLWFTFYYDRNIKKWKCSIRSKKLPVNQLVSKYNGGGHKLAAGLTFTRKRQMKCFLKDVKKFLNENILLDNIKK